MRRGLLAAGLAATIACSAATPAPVARTAVAQPVVGGADEDRPLARLQRGLDGRPAVANSTRNPFRFAARGGAQEGASQSPAALPPAESLPVLPLPLAQPPLRLLGVITMADGSRLASIAVGGDLVVASAGQLLAGRFRVGRIDADAVELTDAVGDRPMRLALP